MKNVIKLIVLALLIVSMPVMAQDETKSDRKAERKERRLAKQAEKKAEIDHLYNLVTNKSFVIDADFLYDRYSRQRIATNNNFVAVQGDKIVLQTASPMGFGYNGMGGVTVVGKIHDYEIKKDKRGESIFVTAQMTSDYAGPGTVFIRINGKDNASARFYGPWGRGIEFSGNVEVPEKSFRYEGQTVPL